jgi:hypothetical protein
MGILVRKTPCIHFLVPIKNLIIKLVAAQFLKWQNQARQQVYPTARRDLVNFDHATILQCYNSVLCGLIGYYNFVGNRKSMSTLVHFLKMSCALTLALKYKLRTAAKVFSVYKVNLKNPEGWLQLSIPVTFAKSHPNNKFKKTMNM